MSVLTILKATKGLNTKHDPARLKYDPEVGIQELPVAVNIDVDDTGRPSRSKGFTRQAAGSFHSLFCDSGTALICSGGGLFVLHPDYTRTGIRNVTAGKRMSYCQIDDKIYNTNGYETGYVKNEVSYAWTVLTYYGPDTKRVLSGPPIGKHLEFYNGRIYITQKDVAWYSEPLDYNSFDLHKNFLQFPSTAIMIRAVKDGIYVSTDKATYFCFGPNPDEGLDWIMVAPYPAIEYSEITINGRMIVTQEGDPVIDTTVNEKAAMWVSTKGVCYGGSSGRFANITQEKIDLPTALIANSFLVDDKFLTTLEP